MRSANLEVDALRGMLVGRDDSARRYTQERCGAMQNAKCKMQNECGMCDVSRSETRLLDEVQLLNAECRVQNAELV